MKALRWHGQKDLRVEDLPEPSPGPGKVKIKVEMCGICGTDLHEYEAGPIFIPTEPHPITGKKAPVILGHEFSGTIVETGKGVAGWKVGDRVTPDACLVCGKCYYCKKGLYHLCDSLGFNGLASDGGFAEYAIAPAYQLYKLDDKMSFEDGALIEPISVGVHALRKGRLLLGETVTIIGAGTIGLATLQAAKAGGAGKIFVVELTETRKKFAEKMGADRVIDPTRENPVDVVKSLNQGKLSDLTVECVGYEKTLQTAISLTMKGGRIVVAGIFSGQFKGDIPYNDIVIGEKELIGTIGYNEDFDRSIKLVASGRINAKDYITARVNLDDAVEKGFEELVRHKDKHIKILISPR